MVKFYVVCPECKGSGKIKVNLTIKITDKPKADAKETNKWIKFVEKDKKPKTKVFSIISKADNTEIGEIKWYPAWRQYCLCTMPTFQSIYSTGCLQTITDFITNLNKKHEAEK